MLLDGLRVIEVASVITGPYAGMLLADLGAEVIKIEPPSQGDAFRGWDGMEGVVRPAFAAYNRGKASVILDLKSERDREALWTLLDSAGALIANMRPGAMDRLGFSWAALHARNPELVYCSISGMGSSGPDLNRPTYDAVAQALSGLWSQLAPLDDPNPVGPPLADQLTGMYAALGVASALARRAAGGDGVHLEVDMLGSCLAFQGLAIANHLADGSVPGANTRARTSQAYGFLAGDGKPFCIHLSSAPKFWNALCAAASRSELATDERFATKTARIKNYSELRSEFSTIFGSQSRDYWIAKLDEWDVPCAPIFDVGEAIEYPQVVESGIVDSGDEHLLALCKSAIKVGDDYLYSRVRPPELGRDTERILGQPEVNV